MIVLVFTSAFWFVQIMYLLFLFKIFIVEMNVSGLGYPSMTKETDITQDLIFPGSAESTEDLLSPLPSPKCYNQTFCENLEDYPSSVLHGILENTTYGKKYIQYFKNLRENEHLVSSRNEEKNEYFICPSTKSIVYPKAAYNINHEMKFIYNLKSYRQGVSIEVCVKRSKCKFYDKIKNFQTKCTQKFMERLLLSADGNGKPYVDRYRFPSACVCSYKDENGSSRFFKFYS